MRTRTVLYLAVLTGLFMFVGYLFAGRDGAIMAFILAVIMNFVSFWFSTNIVLMLYGAKEMPEAQFPGIYRMIRELSMKYAMPMPRVYLIDMPQPNAFATGRDERHAIVGITAGILNLLTEEEMRGVLSHELSHIKNKDMLISTMAATLAGAISLIGRLAFFGSHDEDSRGNVISFVIFLILTPIIAMLIQLAISRTREYEADRSGAQLLGSGISLANGLKKLHANVAAHPVAGTQAQQAASHLFIVNPFRPSFLMHLFSTHPPMEERVRRLEQMHFTH